MTGTRATWEDTYGNPNPKIVCVGLNYAEHVTEMAKNAKWYQTTTEKIRVSTIWVCMSPRLIAKMPAPMRGGQGSGSVFMKRGRRALRVHLHDVDSGLRDLARAVEEAFH